MTQPDDIRNLIRNHNRRLQKLKEQQALYGLEAPPRILLEIEDIEAKLKQLRTELEAIENDPNTLEKRVQEQRQRVAIGVAEIRRQSTERSHLNSNQKRLSVIGRPPTSLVEHFKDRIHEQKRIKTLLAEPTTRLVSIIGHGGIGKTALASKVIRDLEQHCWPETDDGIPLDGIVYLSTRTSGISLERLFLDCAKMLGNEQEKELNAVWTDLKLDVKEKVFLLLDALREGHFLILLDNMEDMLDDKGQLANEDLRLFFDHALTIAHGAQLLVTSRLALHFGCEVMRFDQQVKILEGLPIAEGIALLRELDPNGDYGVRDTADEELARAVTLVHGVPRALEVMMGILANDPFASLAEVMGHFYEQEDVVRALIEENYKRLDSNARRTIEALAVFKRPVLPLAVDYLLEPFVPGLDVPGILLRLIRTNIVSIDRVTKTVTLHPIDQDYAYSQLKEEETGEITYTRQALERRAADYYIQLRTPPETWKTIYDLEPQLAEFEHRIRAADYDKALEILEALDFQYLFLWVHISKLAQLRERLEGHLAHPDTQLANLEGQGRAYHHLGQFERAIKYHEKALLIADKIDDYHRQGFQLGRIGFIYHDLGQIEQAINYYERASATYQGIEDGKGEGVQLGRLGRAYQDLGQIEQAIVYYEKALQVARGISYRPAEAAWLGYLGRAYYTLYQIELALRFYQEAVSIADEVNSYWDRCMWRGGLGRVYYVLGQTQKAIDYYQDALHIAQTGSPDAKCYQLIGLSRVLLDQGSLLEAEQLCAQALILNTPATNYHAALVLGFIRLHQHNETAGEIFEDVTVRCRAVLEKTESLYEPRYILATALVGKAVTDLRWAKERERTELLAMALSEYQRAFEVCNASGIVQDAIRDLKLIQAAGIKGLEPVFELLMSVLDE